MNWPTAAVILGVLALLAIFALLIPGLAVTIMQGIGWLVVAVIFCFALSLLG